MFFISNRLLSSCISYMVGSLTGAVASQIVTEACDSSERSEIVRRVQWHKLSDCETDKSSRVGDGHSDPVVLSGRAIAQRIKGTPGITGWYCPRAHIDGSVWHLDVGSSHPGAGAGPKGLAVRQLKWYELGSERRETVRSLSVMRVEELEELSLVREDRDGRTTGGPVVAPVAVPGS